MIKLEQNMSHSDIKQWLNGGIFLYDHPDIEGLIPARFESTASTQGGHQEYFDPNASWEICPVIHTTLPIKQVKTKDLPFVVFPHWPLCGAINIQSKKVAIYVKRLQVKQWKRTYCRNCVKFIYPNQWITRRILQNSCFDSYDPQIVKEIFSPNYFDPLLVKEKFKEGWHSLAVNRFLIITNTRPRLFYYNGSLVAKIHTPTEIDVYDSIAFKKSLKILPNGEYI